MPRRACHSSKWPPNRHLYSTYNLYHCLSDGRDRFHQWADRKWKNRSTMYSLRPPTNDSHISPQVWLCASSRRRCRPCPYRVLKFRYLSSIPGAAPIGVCCHLFPPCGSHWHQAPVYLSTNDPTMDLYTVILIFGK
jgi:hypothetical protein